MLIAFNIRLLWLNQKLIWQSEGKSFEIDTKHEEY